MSRNIEKTDVATCAAQGARNGSHLLGRAIREGSNVDDGNGTHGHLSERSAASHEAIFVPGRPLRGCSPSINTGRSFTSFWRFQLISCNCTSEGHASTRPGMTG